MLASLRQFAGTWPARVFFLILVAAFGSWGISDVVRNAIGGGGALATVGGQPVAQADFQQAFQREWGQVVRQFPDPGQVPPALRQQAARQALDQVIGEQAIANEVARLGLVAPDASVRTAVFAMPVFAGTDGHFDREKFNAVLQANQLTEPRFLDLVRKDMAQEELLKPIAAGAAPPAALTRLFYGFFYETRRAHYVALPLAGQPPPAAPDEPVLRRYYQNNQPAFTAPELRRVQVVVLSAATIGRSLPMSDADLQTWFAAHRGEFQSPEKRAVQVVTAAKQADAQAILAAWQAGAGWDQVQALARARGAAAAAMDDATPADFPSPALGQAVFAAKAGVITGPVADPLGFMVLRVGKITPAANPTVASLHDTIAARLGAEKAADLIDARVQKLQDALAGGATLNEVPGDLGADGETGTLDAEGNTQGQPAPIPLAPAARAQFLADAFRAAPGGAPHLTEAADHSWYAFQVQSIAKPALKPYDAVRDAVLAGWRQAQVAHDQEATATKLMTLVKSGASLANAAWGSGRTVQQSPPLRREQAAPPLTRDLVARLFAMKKGEATMAATADGYIVAVVDEIDPPNPAADPHGFDQVRQQLAKSMQDDAMDTYARALRERAHPTVNEKMLAQASQ